MKCIYVPPLEAVEERKRANCSWVGRWVGGWRRRANGLRVCGWVGGQLFLLWAWLFALRALVPALGAAFFVEDSFSAVGVTFCLEVNFPCSGRGCLP